MSKPNTICIICQKPIYRIPSRLNNNNSCSTACRNKRFVKENHPKWKGGEEPRKIKTRLHEKWKKFHNKQKAVHILGGQCQKCGYAACIAALDFHHVNPKEKDATLKDMWSRNWNIIIAEIKKCKLLCSNCHREEHWLENHTSLSEL
jgi:hypothetical protein